MTDAKMPKYDGMEYEELVVAAQYLWMVNAKLRELIKLADKLMQGVLEHSKDTVVVSDLPCCDTLYDRLVEYRQAERELGMELDG